MTYTLASQFFAMLDTDRLAEPKLTLSASHVSEVEEIIECDLAVREIVARCQRAIQALEDATNVPSGRYAEVIKQVGYALDYMPAERSVGDDPFE